MKEKAKEKTRKFLHLAPVKEEPPRQESTGSGAHLANPHADADSQPTDDMEHGPTEPDEQDEEMPELSLRMTIGLLVVVTVLVAVTAEWLVDSIDGLASGGGISKEFIGLILLPIVGNAAEHVTAVTVSVKDKLTLSLGVAVGSSIVSPLLHNPVASDVKRTELSPPPPPSKSRCSSSRSSLP